MPTTVHICKSCEAGRVAFFQQPDTWHCEAATQWAAKISAAVYLCGKLQVIRPHNGSHKGLQACLFAAEQRLIVALILAVLLRRFGGKDGMTVVPESDSLLAS